MSIQRAVSFVLSIIGDGTSTTYSIDLANMIHIQGILPVTPVGIQNVVLNNFMIVPATLLGTIVNISFPTPPVVGNSNLSINLLF